MVEGKKNIAVDELENSNEKMLETARISAQAHVADRVKHYDDLLVDFDDMIESYDVLIAIVKENKGRFTKRYEDIVSQFSATRDSFRIQRKNTDRHRRLLQKILNNPGKYSARDMLEALRIK